MNYTSKILKVSAITVILVYLIGLANCSYVREHCCTGEKYSICEELKVTRDMLKVFKSALVATFLYLVMLLKYLDNLVFCRHDEKGHYLSPVQLKVRLLN